MAGTFSPEVIETYRTHAKRLLSERYSGNQSAFARDLGIRSPNIKRFVVNEEGGISSQVAQKLSKLAGLPYPLPEAMKSVPPPPRQPKVSPSKDELELTLAFFYDRWPAEIAEIARCLVKHRKLTRGRNDWIELLDELESVLDKYK